VENVCNSASYTGYFSFPAAGRIITGTREDDDDDTASSAGPLLLLLLLPEPN
jgi:hypothetical protein